MRGLNPVKSLPPRGKTTLPPSVAINRLLNS
jgi:hypothetical protein